jgi:hypothetical protein
MVESPRDPDPNAPQNPPASVVNKDVRRSALWTYLLPLVLFFVGVGVLLIYWNVSPPVSDREAYRGGEPLAEGTAGTEGERTAGRGTPGGQNPDRRPETTRDEVTDRTGEPIIELGEAFGERTRPSIGRRVEVKDVDVESVESPTLFWARDGNARVPVLHAESDAPLKPGQSVNIHGTVEALGNGVRIRATRVELSQ